MRPLRKYNPCKEQRSRIRISGRLMMRPVIIGVLLLTFLSVLFQAGHWAYAQAPDRPLEPQTGIGKVNTPEDFDRLLRALGSGDVGLREDAELILNQMGEIAIPALIQLGLWNADPLLHQNAIRVLANMGKPASEHLVKALKDKETRVRAGATTALGMMADPATIEPLVRVLGDKVASVRQEAFSALATFGPLATSNLIKALPDPHPDIRRNAAVLLQKIGRPAVAPLIRTLKHANPQVRATTANVLSAIGDPSAISYLIPMLGDQEASVRQSVITALAQFRAQAVKPLITVVEGTNTALQDAALLTLKEIGKPAIPVLSRFIQDPSHPYDQRAKTGQLLNQLGWIPKNATEQIWGHIVTGQWKKIANVPQALSPLMVTMGEPLEEVRKSASRAIVPFGAKAVTALATEILRRKDPLFLESAANALGDIQIRDFLAVEALTGLLQNRSFPVQSAVIKTLGKIGNYIAVPPLLGVVEDIRRPLPIRISAVDALEKLGDPRIVPRLLAVMERTQNVDFQEKLIYTLGELRNPEAVPHLIKRLGHENMTLRKMAGDALIKIRPLPIAPLIDLLADPHLLVQNEAAALLARIGEPAVAQLVSTLKERNTSPNMKAQAELLLIKLIEALPGNADALIKALEAPSDRVRLLAIQSLSEIKTIRAVPSLLDIAEQEWRYPAHLREQAKQALQKIQDSADSQKWEEILEQRRLAYYKKLTVLGQIGLRIFYAFLGYWLIMSLLGMALSKIVSRVPYVSYRRHLLDLVHHYEEPLSQEAVQKRLRVGFLNVWAGMFMGLLLTGGGVAILVWARIINSIAWTFSVWGTLFALGCWFQSAYGLKQIIRLMEYRRKVARVLLAPLTYLGLLLFPITTEESVPSEAPVQVPPPPPIDSPEEAPAAEEPLTSFATLLSDFPRSERIDILQGLGEHAARFPPMDPHEVLDFVFKETFERLRLYKESNRKEDIRAFLTTLVPMAMALSEQMREIPVTLSKMVALVGASNSFVKLERFFADVLNAVDAAILKGSFPILLEILQAGFFPTTELIEEAKTSTDRPLLYYAWREIISTRIQKEQFNVSDAMHIALHYTSFRQRAQQSRILNLIGYASHYDDYKKVVDQWKKGSRKNAERIKHLREISDQFAQFIQHMDERNMVLASPWLTRRLSETFGSDGHPANWLFVVNKSGVGMAPSFLAVDSKIPESFAEPRQAPAAASSVDAFDALMSQ